MYFNEEIKNIKIIAKENHLEVDLISKILNKYINRHNINKFEKLKRKMIKIIKQKKN